MSDNWTADLWDNHRRFTTARDRLRALPREREQALRTIEHDDALAEPEREIQTKQAKRKYPGEFETLKNTAADAERKHRELVRGMRAARRVDLGAQGRVRTLLEKGLPASKIIERAVEQRDPEVIAALRAEMPWWGDRDGVRRHRRSARSLRPRTRTDRRRQRGRPQRSRSQVRKGQRRHSPRSSSSARRPSRTPHSQRPAPDGVRRREPGQR